MSYNRFKSWDPSDVWNQDPTTTSSSDPKIWTTTSALGADGIAVSKMPKITPTEGMKNIWSNPGQNNQGLNFAQSIEAGKGLKIGGEGKFLGMGEGGWSKGSAILGGLSKIIGMMKKDKGSPVAQDMGFSGKADAGIPDIGPAIANVNVHDDLFPA